MISPMIVAVAAGLAAPPRADVETLGVYRRIADAVDEPIEEFNPDHWIQEGEGMSALAYRYEIAFAAYGVAALAERTPAYRKPYQQTLDRLIRKMLQQEVWGYWLEADWGGDDPLTPYNIMYSGHLALMLTLYRKISGDTSYEDGFTLEDSVFSSNAGALVHELHDRTAKNQDSAGSKYHSICCETGWVFVPCNTPHNYGHVLLDSMDGTEFGAATEEWIAWLKDHMVDPHNGALYSAYFPFEDPPAFDTSTQGVYNGWSIAYLHAMDSDWALELYEDYKASFVEPDGWGEGRTVVHNTPGESDLAQDFASTAFGMVVARELEDQELFEGTAAASDLVLGGRAWSDDGRTYGYDSTLVPTVVANLHLLLAMALSEGFTLRDNALRPWSMGGFNLPFVADVSNVEPLVGTPSLKV